MWKKFVLSTLVLVAMSLPLQAEETGHGTAHDAGQMQMPPGHGPIHDAGQMQMPPGHGAIHDAGQMQMPPGHGDAHGGGQGEMKLLGEETVDGIKAVAHLNDVREAMAKAGMQATHHLQILFTDEASGETIEDGVVAVRISSSTGENGPPTVLHGMEGHFGVDLTLDKPADYSFAVGTKLPDGKKRQYLFEAPVQ